MDTEKATAQLTEAGQRWTTAKQNERTAMRELYAAINVACQAGITESEAARLAGVDRMTVRRALGKQPTKGTTMMNLNELAATVRERFDSGMTVESVSKDLRVLYGTALDAAEVPVNVARKYLADGYNRVNNRDQ